jgi:hypothetical protein
MLPPLGGIYQKTLKRWAFPRGPLCGATLYLAHLDNEQDASNYQGLSLTLVGVDEAGDYPTPNAIVRLFGSLRSAHGVKCQLLLTGNPGGPGNMWLKKRYVDPAPDGTVITDPATGLTRVFIRAFLRDNPILVQNDPHYEARLRMLGNPALVRAWFDGDFSSPVSAYFADVLNPETQLVPDIAPIEKQPHDCQLIRSFDWGMAKPSSVGHWLETGNLPIVFADGSKRWFPKYSMIRFDELYVAERDASGYVIPNVGRRRFSNADLGREIQRFGAGIPFDKSVADPSIFTGDSDSHYSQMRLGAPGLEFSPAAIRERVTGWSYMRGVLTRYGVSWRFRKRRLCKCTRGF